MWVTAWQQVSCLVSYLSPPSKPTSWQITSTTWPGKDGGEDRSAHGALGGFAKNIWQRRTASVWIQLLVPCNVFSLNTVTLWCEAKCAERPKRPRGAAEVWSLRATFKHRGAVPFPESRKLTFEEARWVRFLSFPPLTPSPGWSAGMQPGEASYGHFLTPEKITHSSSVWFVFIVAARRRREAISCNYASEIVSEV